MAKGRKTGGRRPGSLNKATADIRELARNYGPEALVELARLAKEAASETARVAAIKEILDRAYGKSPQAVTLDSELSIQAPQITEDMTPAQAAEAFAMTLRAAQR
jgi:hypothetical protein